MNEKSTKFSRENVYKNERQIKELVGESYSDTMCHRMKDKDTFKELIPTASIIPPEQIFKTSKNTLETKVYVDPDYDTSYHFKMDMNKRYTEEMLKAKNMMMKKKKDDGKSG